MTPNPARKIDNTEPPVAWGQVLASVSTVGAFATTWAAVGLWAMRENIADIQGTVAGADFLGMVLTLSASFAVTHAYFFSNKAGLVASKLWALFALAGAGALHLVLGDAGHLISPLVVGALLHQMTPKNTFDELHPRKGRGD